MDAGRRAGLLKKTEGPTTPRPEVVSKFEPAGCVEDTSFLHYQPNQLPRTDTGQWDAEAEMTATTPKPWSLSTRHLCGTLSGLSRALGNRSLQSVAPRV